MNPVLVACYRDRMLPFLTECFVFHESSIGAFAGHFFKFYDFERNKLHDVSLADLDVFCCDLFCFMFFFFFKPWWFFSEWKKMSEISCDDK